MGPPVSSTDREIAAQCAARINEFWRSRGKEANARVIASGEIVSDFSAPPSPRRTVKQEMEARVAANARADLLRRAKYLDYLKSRPTGRTLKEIVRALNISDTAAYYELKRMRVDGLVEAYRTRENAPIFYRLAAGAPA